MEVVNVNGTDFQLKEWFDRNKICGNWEVKRLKKVCPGMWDKVGLIGWFLTKESALKYLNDLPKNQYVKSY